MMVRMSRQLFAAGGEPVNDVRQDVYPGTGAAGHPHVRVLQDERRGDVFGVIPGLR